MTRTVPIKYIPASLSIKDKKRQKAQLEKSRKMYKKKKYHTRKKMASFKSKKSSHVTRAEKMYNVSRVVPSKQLSKKTGCSIKSLNDIVSKGQGAYYSSGSRPNQTAHSWGYARLASAITGGKSSAIDFHILKKGCKKTSKALKLAKKYMKKNGKGTRRVRKYVGGVSMQSHDQDMRVSSIERIVNNLYSNFYTRNQTQDFRDSVRGEIEDFIMDVLQRVFDTETPNDEREELKLALKSALSTNRDIDKGGHLSRYLRHFTRGIFETTAEYREYQNTQPVNYRYIMDLTDLNDV